MLGNHLRKWEGGWWVGVDDYVWWENLDRLNRAVEREDGEDWHLFVYD